MAKTVQINIKIDSADGKRSLGVLNKEGKVVLKTMADMEEASAQITEQLKNTKVGTDAYQDLSKELIKVNKELRNQELALEALDHEQVASELKSVVGGLTEMAGGMALIGVSNENIEKVVQTMAKVEGITKGVTGAIEAYQSGMKLLRNATKAQTVVQGILNAVMSANPIGLIVIGIAALVAAFVAFKQPIMDFIASFDSLYDVMLLLLGPIGWIILAYEALFGEEAKAEEAREKASKENNRRTKERIANIKAEHAAFVEATDKENEILEKKIKINENLGKSSYALRVQELENNRAVVQSHIDSVAKIIEAKITQYKEQAKINGQTEQEFKDMMKAQGVDLDELYTRATEIQEGLQLDLLVSESEITKVKREEYEKRNEKAKEAAEKELRIQQEIHQRMIDEFNQYLAEREAIENEYFENRFLTAQQREENAVEDKYFNLIEQAKKYGEDTAVLEEARQWELDNIQKKYAAKENQELKKQLAIQSDTKLKAFMFDAERDGKLTKQEIATGLELELDALETQRQLALANTELTEAEKAAIEEEYRQKKLLAEEAAQQKQQEQFQATIGQIQMQLNMYGGAVLEAMSLFNEAMTQQAEYAAYEREQTFNKETQALKNQLANREINQKEYDAKIRVLEFKKEQEEIAAKKKAFKRTKALNIAQAVMSGANAVLAGLATAPLLPVGIIMAAVAAALSGVQIGIISSQKFTAARGGIVPGGPSKVDTVDAKLAGGEAIINAESTAMFPQLLSSINQAGGGISLAPEPAPISSPVPVGGFGGGRPVYADNRDQQQPIVKAIVVESDMTDSQKRIKRIENSVTFG